MQRALGTAVAVLLAGCALRPPAPLPPASAHELLETLAARRAAVSTLRARARLRAGLEGVWTREALLVQRPDALRIDVLTPFGLALAVGARADVLWAFPPAERTRYEGAATPANLTRFLGAPLEVADIVDILLGVPPARDVTGPPELSVTREREYQLTLPLAEGTQTIWFAGDSRAVVRAEERRAGGVALRVAFAEYQDGFPRALEIGAPASGASVRLAYDQVEPNVPLDASLFAPPPASRVLPLDAAAPPPPSP